MIAFIVPVFKHSVLVFDAIASLVDQNRFPNTELVIVDDGCPNAQTFLSLAGLTAEFSNVHYIRHANRGLSGARNRGIEFVLKQLKQVEAVYFLDSDNRVSSDSIEIFEAALQNSDADWFYPNIDMFGIEWHGDYDGPFRRFTEVFQNICEAGSLVRINVFKEGVRFDEAMKDGYEDWEFWLAAIENGFRGEFLPASGFRYRKRAESMLVESGRLDSSIKAYIERKHKWISDFSTLCSMEHVDAPRYAIINLQRSSVRLTSDPSQPGLTKDLSAYTRDLLNSFSRPNLPSVGSFLIFASPIVLDQLDKRGLLNWLFFDIEQRLLGSNFAVVSCRQGQDERVAVGLRDCVDTLSVHVIAISMTLLRAILLDREGTWIHQLRHLSPTMKINVRDVTCPGWLAESSGQAHIDLIEFCDVERRRGYLPLWSGLHGNGRGTPDVAELPFIARKRFGDAPLPNKVGSRFKRIAFAVPIYEYGGVEKTVTAIAFELKKIGYSVDLHVVGCKTLSLRSVTSAFDDIFFHDLYNFNAFSGPEFLGTNLPALSYPNECFALSNALSCYEVVVASHSADTLGCFATLAKRGIITVNYLHLIEYTKAGRMIGHPILGIAYEHSTDLFLTCSTALSIEMGMLGVPSEKIVAIPNATTFDPILAAPNALANKMETLLQGRSLNVLYIGRLDQQKGIEHITQIMRVLRCEPAKYSVAVVGSAIIDDLTPTLQDLAAVLHAPIHDDQGLAEIYQWADILIMPSLYEGLPLTLLEAKLFGVVPIVTAVGAVEEAIENGVDGFVIHDANVAQAMLSCIYLLDSDRERFVRMSRSAAIIAEKRTWSSVAKSLHEAFAKVTAARKLKTTFFPWLQGEMSAQDSAAVSPSN